MLWCACHQRSSALPRIRRVQWGIMFGEAGARKDDSYPSTSRSPFQKALHCTSGKIVLVFSERDLIRHDPCEPSALVICIQKLTRILVHDLGPRRFECGVRASQVDRVRYA